MPTGQLSSKATCEAADREQTKPEQIFCYLDTSKQNLNNYISRLETVFERLSGPFQRGKKDEDKDENLTGPTGMFDLMLAKHQVNAQLADRLYSVLCDIERVVGIE